MKDKLEIEPVAFGKLVRNARRNLGMTQGVLSSLLGMSQTSVSRWESGVEEMPRRHKLHLIDLLTNKCGRIDPLIERLIRNDPTIAVASRDLSTVLRESEYILNAYRLHRNEVDGSEYARVYESRWRQSTPYSFEFYLAEYFRDIDLAGETAARTGHRLRIKMFSVQLSGQEPIYVRRNNIVGPSTGRVDAEMIEYLKIDDLE